MSEHARERTSSSIRLFAKSDDVAGFPARMREQLKGKEC
jgi:hypothetical protein